MAGETSELGCVFPSNTTIRLVENCGNKNLSESESFFLTLAFPFRKKRQKNEKRRRKTKKSIDTYSIESTIVMLIN